MRINYLSFKNVYLCKAVMKKNPKWVCLITFQLSGSSRAGARYGELGLSLLPNPAPQCFGKRSRTEVGYQGHVRPIQEVRAPQRPPQYRQTNLGKDQSFNTSPKSGAEALSRHPQNFSLLFVFLPDILSEVHLIKADLEHMQQILRK